ncbi:hypothetical protein AAX19_09305 [Oenococcus oeni]|nr:hypothetical protein AAX19_09305 [Oenococcus oeni]
MLDKLSNPNLPELLTKKRVSQLLKINVITVDRLIASGDIPTWSTDKSVFIPTNLLRRALGYNIGDMNATPIKGE